MSRFLLGVVVCAFVFYGYQRVNHPEPPAPSGQAVADPDLVERPAGAATTEAFRCNGRTRCTEMTSCEEAIFFLRNCPGVQMDGEGDGIPCERQWCSHL